MIRSSFEHKESFFIIILLFYLYNTQAVLHYVFRTKYLCIGVMCMCVRINEYKKLNETHEERDSSCIEWEDQAFKHGNGKSTRETSSTQLLLLFYLSFYSEVLFSPCVSFSRLISVYFELLMLLRRLMTLLSHLLVFYY